MEIRKYAKTITQKTGFKIDLIVWKYVSLLFFELYYLSLK